MTRLAIEEHLNVLFRWDGFQEIMSRPATAVEVENNSKIRREVSGDDLTT